MRAEIKVPRYLIKTLVPKIDARWETIRPNLLPFLGVVSVFMGFYYASKHIPAGWITYVLSAISLIVIGVTALARVNDIEHTQTSARWQVRRLGLILVGAACIGIVVAPFIATPGQVADFPAWREVMMRWGVALTWVTTPQMPPWHHYIGGDYRKLRIEVPNDVVVEVMRTETVENTNGAMMEGGSETKNS